MDSDSRPSDGVEAVVIGPDSGLDQEQLPLVNSLNINGDGESLSSSDGKRDAVLDLGGGGGAAIARRPAPLSATLFTRRQQIQWMLAAVAILLFFGILVRRDVDVSVDVWLVHANTGMRLACTYWTLISASISHLQVPSIRSQLSYRTVHVT